MIRELDANNVLKEYVRGLYIGGEIGGIIYQKKGSDYYYYHYNHKGDVVALTDGTGELAAYYEYDACLPAFARRGCGTIEVWCALAGDGRLSGQGLPGCAGHPSDGFEAWCALSAYA